MTTLLTSGRSDADGWDHQYDPSLSLGGWIPNWGSSQCLLEVMLTGCARMSVMMANEFVGVECGIEGSGECRREIRSSQETI